ncbi:MAG: bifunctional diaminohydroxyphosphoribosylaminopyrimidine deaminase/5-amino-6-(5-phosphoribosylamino)uracil reductase RibD [Phycisphaerae bacterium]
MLQAVDLARRGRGFVEPNPMVGCVLVRDGRVVASGYHAIYGGPHAEPEALAALAASGGSGRSDAHGVTAYVTLEPCSHTNKKTPPCAPRLIEAGVKRVVVGCRDPNPLVDGRGIAMLRSAGVDVTTGVLEAVCRQLIAPFYARTVLKRPYVTAKVALSRDGRMAGALGRPVRITNAASDRLVHQLRARCDAIAVGTNTVRNDDPSLTVRGVPVVRRPVRVVLSSRLEHLVPGRKLFATAREVPTLVYAAETADAGRVEALRALGVEVVLLAAAEGGRFAFPDALRNLAARGHSHLMLEPGPTLAAALAARGQLDRLWRFESPKEVGEAGLSAPDVLLRGTAAFDEAWREVARADLDGDTFSEHLNPAGEAFFAAVAGTEAALATQPA